MSVDGQLIFSKHQEGRFPTEPEIIARLRRLSRSSVSVDLAGRCVSAASTETAQRPFLGRARVSQSVLRLRGTFRPDEVICRYSRIDGVTRVPTAQVPPTTQRLAVASKGARVVWC